ncbi:DUF4189 domain-containing protein [Luteibacter jiangsuensis]|uniref:DUF4189 domain-containing protein n=1 Tax=Luteibacter jiangsuensis TaxID=637577 RepID=A0ABX0Q8A0_9GAMM|nr:DUF4189 domain-containing protein [Luteibacter jiangsuensis]
MYRARLITLLLLCFFSLNAVAEGGCPQGQYPQQGNGWRACVPINNPSRTDGSADTFRGPVWVARWIALASDTPKGILGKGINGASELEATQAAKNDCSAHGGTDCQIIGIVKNQCIAMAVGSKQLATSEGPTQMTAERLAIGKCQKNGPSDCTTYYSACAQPTLAN